MTLSDVLARLDSPKTSDHKQYIAKCPAHDDRKASLCISTGEDGRILLKCQAGCDYRDVAAAIGITEADLFPPKEDKPYIVATYQYQDASGVIVGEKLRYSDKHFTWRRPKGGGWDYHKPAETPLYNLPALLQSDYVFLVEGEKDVDNLKAQGIPAVCSPDGAGPGKWKSRLSSWFKDKRVYIIQDNDDVGKAYAQEEAQKISGVSQLVKVLDLCGVWPEIPEHGDISDLMQHIGAGNAINALKKLVSDTPEWIEPAQEDDPFLSCFHTLDGFSEEEAEWLVPGWIPKGQITLMAADGGIGKTTIWCNIVAALSSGKPCILDPPGGVIRPPYKVAFLTTEDSVRKKLKRKLRLAGANEHNIITPDFLEDKSGLLRALKFGTDELERFVRYFKPALCVFDPVQGFIPPDINMGNRNAMRDCMAPLISLGEECNTTFLVICHTNKRKGASGRDRIADSADLWDISRSVIMAGYTDAQGIRYLSNEKNNYSALQETLLFTIDPDGQAQATGTTWKRDREYMQDVAAQTTSNKRENCKEFILDALELAGGKMESQELEDQLKENDFAVRTWKRARAELKDEGLINTTATGFGKNKVWYVELTKGVNSPDSG